MKLKRNSYIVIAIIVIMLFMQSYDLINKPSPYNSIISFYYKDNFFSQTKVSLLPTSEKETAIKTDNDRFFGLLQRGSSSSLRHHANDEMMQGTFIKINNKEMHYVGIINSPDIVHLLVHDEKNNSLSVNFVSESEPIPQQSLSRSGKQYFYIIDVPNRLIITMFDEHGEKLGEHHFSTNE